MFVREKSRLNLNNRLLMYGFTFNTHTHTHTHTHVDMHACVNTMLLLRLATCKGEYN